DLIANIRVILVGSDGAGSAGRRYELHALRFPTNVVRRKIRHACLRFSSKGQCDPCANQTRQDACADHPGASEHHLSAKLAFPDRHCDCHFGGCAVTIDPEKCASRAPLRNVARIATLIAVLASGAEAQSQWREYAYSDQQFAAAFPAPPRV